MKILNNQKGAITIITLVSILFMVSFLVSSYVIISNKSKEQQEMVEETRRIYESASTMEEIYNSYFDSSELIPIYTVEQLLSIGSDKVITISQNNGKIYTFSKDANYILMNDLEFSAEDWTDLIGVDEDGNPIDWVPIGEVIKDDIDGFTGNFEGNGYKITVTDLEGVTHECNSENEYYYYRNIDIKIKQTETFDSTGEFEVIVTHSVRRGNYYNIYKRCISRGRRSDTYISKSKLILEM